MKELIELFAEKVGRYPRGNVQDELRSWAANEITTLRQQLEQAQAESVQAAQQGSVPEGWGYVVEVFLENVEEVTELLLSGGAADNIVALCNDLNKAATVAEKVLSTPQPEGDGWLRLPGDANNHRCLLYTPSEQAGIEYRIVPAGFVKTVSDATHYIPLKPPTGLKRPQPPQEGE